MTFLTLDEINMNEIYAPYRGFGADKNSEFMERINNDRIKKIRQIRKEFKTTYKNQVEKIYEDFKESYGEGYYHEFIYTGGIKNPDCKSQQLKYILKYIYDSDYAVDGEKLHSQYLLCDMKRLLKNFEIIKRRYKIAKSGYKSYYPK